MNDNTICKGCPSSSLPCLDFALLLLLADTDASRPRPLLFHHETTTQHTTMQAIAHKGFSLINIAIDPLCGTESGSLQDHN